MPDAEGLGRSAQEGEIREYRPDDGVDQSATRAETPHDFWTDCCLVGQDSGLGCRRRVFRTEGNNTMAMTRREETALPRLPSRYRGAKAGADGGEVTPRHMVSVAGKIFRREFPVTRDDPLMHPTNDLNAALTTVEERVQVPRHLPEIV